MWNEEVLTESLNSMWGPGLNPMSESGMGTKSGEGLNPTNESGMGIEFEDCFDLLGAFGGGLSSDSDEEGEDIEQRDSKDPASGSQRQGKSALRSRVGMVTQKIKARRGNDLVEGEGSGNGRNSSSNDVEGSGAEADGSNSNVSMSPTAEELCCS
ncbi:hypothetical protein PIB30_089511 [Stylosanthes scabra]|uniref:Uncharacterized protein n=1 Tax=Stylosanthes scabra TaxID=79078 RepID=A0ABU6XT30_9FABA|nr:hypothetical protein [Stylosanthes scabra]